MDTFLFSYYSGQVGRFRKMILSVSGKHSAHDIHQLRLSIKKIRAVYELLQGIYPEEFGARDHYRLFKPLFKNLGLAREKQINLKMIKGIDGMDDLVKAYRSYVNRYLKIRDEQTSLSISAFDYDILDSHIREVGILLNSFQDNELAVICSGHIMTEAKRIRKIFSSTVMTDSLHEIRVIIKNLKPILLLLKDFKDLPFKPTVYKKVDTTETLIGKWHDWVILNSSMTEFSLTREDQGSRMGKYFRKLFKRADRELRQYEDEIRVSLDQMLSDLMA